MDKANDMAARTSVTPDTTFRLDLSARGYQVLFWRDAVNRCPGCGQSQWYIGRVTAECGICSTALPINEASQAGFDPIGRKAVALHVIDGDKANAEMKERRREERVDAEGRTVALHIDGSAHAFAIRDISAGGVKGVTLPGIAEAKQLIVELEDGTTLPAELKWSNGTFAGLAFVK